jgi:hypothetical protein
MGSISGAFDWIAPTIGFFRRRKQHTSVFNGVTLIEIGKLTCPIKYGRQLEKYVVGQHIGLF